MDPNKNFKSGWTRTGILNRDGPEIGILNQDGPEQEFRTGIVLSRNFKIGVDPKHEFRNHAKRRVIWFAWPCAWTALCAATDDDLPSLALLWTSVVW
ncbi:hypothetical protein CRG98_010734 [Punica granatum]|uniref:Uncharacterized protein n=1 Tax=Punica granatum TaxID=22663 RepID=A0A2I0KKB1_PUNGR|nr:hypothetical protein CRG98_010734 [Punica granatum]